MGDGSAIPVVSSRMQSNVSRRPRNLIRALTRSPRTVQHTQPLSIVMMSSDYTRAVPENENEGGGEGRGGVPLRYQRRRRRREIAVYITPKDLSAKTQKSKQVESHFYEHTSPVIMITPTPHITPFACLPPGEEREASETRDGDVPITTREPRVPRLQKNLPRSCRRENPD